MNPTKPSDFNDINFPIEPIWALKSTIPSLFLLPIFAGLFAFFFWGQLQTGDWSHSLRSILYFGIIILAVPMHFFSNVIQRATFHFQFDDKFLNLKQGLIRRQNRQLPFGVIQNVLLTRGILDRIFGLSTLTIQNATQSSLQDVKTQTAGAAGFFGNTIQIPGLTAENAEVVKQALLNKVKQSPTIELGM